LKTGGRVSLVGFDHGQFQRAAETVEILKQEKRCSKNVVKFKAGAELEGAVN
jgi:nucleoid DNA-binding protein